MPKNNVLQVIREKNLRGVVGPASLLTDEMLTNLIDYIELSSPGSVQETKDLLAEADDESKWISLNDIRKEISGD